MDRGHPLHLFGDMVYTFCLPVRQQEVRLLRQLLGDGAVTRHVVGRTEDDALVPLDEVVECIAVHRGWRTSPA